MSLLQANPEVVGQLFWYSRRDFWDAKGDSYMERLKGNGVGQKEMPCEGVGGKEGKVVMS